MKKYKKAKSYYSDYWLDKSLFTPTTYRGTYRADGSGDDYQVKTNDLIKLASYKRAISNFVRIVTNKPIPVKFSTGNQSYTDGNSVVISSKMDDAEFDPAVGLALHEGSHIKLTDFTILEKYFKPGTAAIPPVIANRIAEMPTVSESDILAVRTLRTYIFQYLKDILNIVEDRRIDNYIYNTAPGYRGYYHSMYDKYFNDSVIDKALVSDEYTTEDWESYMFRLCNITNKHRRLDALKSLPAIWDLLDLKNIGRLKTTTDSLELASNIFLTIFDAVYTKPTEEDNQSSSGDGNESSSGDSNGNSPMTGDFDSPQTGNDSMESDGNGNLDMSNSSDGDSSDDDSSDGDSSDGDSSNNSSGGSGNTLSPSLKNKLNNAIKKQKDFLNGDIAKKKIGKTESSVVNALDESDVDLKTVSAENRWGSVQKTKCYLVKKLTQSLIESQAFAITTNYNGHFDENQKYIDKGIALGVLLGKKLKTRDENRSLVTPRLKSGKISSRMLHEVGFGNFNIFEKIQTNSVKPVTLHISVDASGSMGGRKWRNTQTAVVAIAKAASMISNINVVISYRSTYDNNTSIPLIVIAYDSRVDNFSKIKNIFKHLIPHGTTPEGLCYEAIMGEILKSKDNSDKYLINFSDGMPTFENKEMSYEGDTAIRHTADQVNKMRMGGVSVLSYFISEHSSERMRNSSYADDFNRMYGKDARFVNINEVMDLAKTLNGKFEVGVQ